MANTGQDALIECREMRKRTRTYRAGADECGASAGRVTTTSRAPHVNGFFARNDGYAMRNDGSAAHDDGYAARDDGYESNSPSDDGYGS